MDMEKLLYYYTRNFALGLALGISVLAGQAAAHPHGWIDVRVNVVVDDEERLVAFEQQWKMDPFYSIALIEELELLAPDNRDEALALMAEEMQSNLAPEDFFTELRIDDESMAFDAVETYRLTATDSEVTLHFTLPLASPPVITGQPVVYKIFEPTYFLEMLHDADRDGPLPDSLTVEGPLECETDIEAADPDPELVMEAARIPIDEEAEYGLGRHFAETVTIQCR